MWDIRYRPLLFSDVLGQEGAVQVLKARLRQGTASDTSYIFAGGAGRGKTTLGRILGRALICQALEDGEPCNKCDNCTAILNESSVAFSEMDAASRGSVEHVRKIVDDLPFAIPGADKRVYLFDETHRMSPAGQDVLLKPIEDKRLVGIFCTTEVEKIRGPIRTRCEEHVIRTITREAVLKRMKMILEQEGASYEDDAVLTVIDHSGGHVRDVINKLETLAQLGPVSVEAVREGLNLSIVSKYYEILLALGEPARSVALLEEVCDRVGPEDASTGLAEAAMNSYRLAHQLHTDFSQANKELAALVYGVYGDTVTKLAEHFTRLYRPTKIGLTCDIVACAAGLPKTREASKVVIQVAAPQIQAPTPQIQEAHQAQATILPPQPVTPPAVVVKATSTEPPKWDESKKGPLGSGDPQALTSNDLKVIPQTMPRGAGEARSPLSKPVTSQKEKILTIEEFRASFFGLCGGLGG